MVGFLDYFLPANNGMNPAQMDQANTSGLLSAAAAIANMNAPHAGPAATPLQLVTGGLQSYGQGANNTLAQYYANQNTQADTTQNQDKALISQLATQRAQQYFAPQGTGNGMASALAGPVPSAGSVPTPMGGAGPAGGVPSGGASPTLSSFYNQPTAGAGAAPNVANGMTDSRTMARTLYKQGMDTMMLGQPGGDKLIEQAIALDPTLAYQKAYNTSAGTSQGALPADLTKIGATGGQARQTAGYEATLRPHDQSVMINGQLYTVPSNDAAASQGLIPNNAQPPSANGISTTVPASAKSTAETTGKDIADANNAAASLDSRLGSARAMISKMTTLAPSTFTGEHGGLAHRMSNEGVGWQKSNANQADFENLNSNLFTQELPAIIKGAGGRLDIPLLNSIKQASAVDPYAPPATKLAILKELDANLARAQVNAHNNVNVLNNKPALDGWTIKKVN